MTGCFTSVHLELFDLFIFLSFFYPVNDGKYIQNKLVKSERVEQWPTEHA